MKHTVKIITILYTLLIFSGNDIFAQKKPVTKPVSKPMVKPVARPVRNSAGSPVRIQTFDNGITMNIKGFKVSAALLRFDNDSKVPDDNTVELNDRINMLITIDSGWRVSGGKVFPGGSEIIKLNTGAEVLRSDDLFKSYEETGVDPGDAKYITLKAIITKLDDKKKYIIVNFRVWDKKGPAELTGSYKFYIR
jgi:hypothetical protein